ncbi:amino acid adenylation domain-containing protein, partial [Candidatus Margulisiibacteriota bacterium]
IYSKLEAWAKTSGVSTFPAILAGIVIYLSIVSGKKDIILGLPLLNRKNAKWRKTCGLFMGVLPLRIKLENNTSFLELAKQIKSELKAVYKHSLFPIGEIYKLSELSYSETLFDAYINYDPTSFTEQFIGCESGAEWVFHGEQTTPVIISIKENHKVDEVEILIDSLIGAFDNIFSLERVKKHFKGLFKECLKSPEKAVKKLTFISAKEKQQLLCHFQNELEEIEISQADFTNIAVTESDRAELYKIMVEWNNTYTPYPEEKCIHELFEEQVMRTPDNLALSEVYGKVKKELTYQELNAKANKLAWYLSKQGIKAEEKVGLYMNKSVEAVIAILGVIKAGGAYIPIDPNYPKERIEYMINDSGLKIILSQGSIVKDLDSFKIPKICVDKDWAKIKKEKTTNLKDRVKINNLAYIIYTSGSTGKPKGVMVEHTGVGNLAYAQIKGFKLDSQSRQMLFASLSFDASVSEIFTAFLCGASLFITNKETIISKDKLAGFFNEHAITHVTLPPTMLNVMEPEQFPNLKTVITAGEACTFELAEKWGKSYLNFLNAYGPTEATVCATMKTVSGTKEAKLNGAFTTPIGKAIDNKEIYILNKRMRPVYLDIIGEIYLGGVGLARGYLNRPDLTRERFVPNPFHPGTYLYKTGDLGKYLPNGDIEFIGRVDHQVKIRGFRVELGEIETMIKETKNVNQVLVLAKKETNQLIAFLEPDKGQKINTDNIRQYLTEELPDYMVPGAFIVVDKFPLTPNKKIDRKALAAMEIDVERSEKGLIRPRNKIERELVRIWENILKVKPIGVNDNFFELGGHSLMIVSMVAQAKKKMNANVSLSAFLQNPTIENVANIIGSTGKGLGYNPLVPLRTTGTKTPIFAVHAVDGNTFCYESIIKHLDAEQPFYALRAQGLDHGTVPISNINIIAAKYIENIKTIQPQGPYMIAGFSIGGIIAFEIARQLKVSGDEVQNLILIDSFAPELSQKYSNEEELFMLLLRDLTILTNINILPAYGKLRGLGDKVTSMDVEKDLKNLSQTEKLNIIWECIKGAELFAGEKEFFLRQFNVYKNLTEAIFAYESEAIDIDTVLFKASGEKIEFGEEITKGWLEDKKILEMMKRLTQNPMLGWEKYVKSVDLEIVEANHYNILQEPNVKLLADKINKVKAKEVVTV